jgi:CubicO group peptidase (beta-lactamase class C family)
MAEKLFAPLGIATYSWEKDEAGNVQTFYGLQLTARDLARIGQMMLDGGKWKGEQLVDPKWIEQSTTASANTPYHGLLWWIRSGRGTVRIPRDGMAELAKKIGAPKSLLELGDRRFRSHAALWLAIGKHLDDRGRERMSQLIEAEEVPLEEEAGPVIGYAADGWLGQQLIVLPKHRVIAVRQHRAPEDGSADGAYNKKYGFFDLIRRLERALP